MPVIKELVSYDDIYNNLKATPILLNKLSIVSIDDREELNKRLITSYSNDSAISGAAECNCGELKGESNLGRVCCKCLSPAIPPQQKTISSLLWFKRPEGMGKLINLDIWTMLDTLLAKKKFNT